MEYRKIGDRQVSVVALGCWALAGGNLWGPQDDHDAIAAIHAALDAGINLFDTAPAYGDGLSEQLLGRALLGRRSQAVIATKFNHECQSGAEIRECCEASLRRLNVEAIDLYQAHWRNRHLPMPEMVQTLEQLRSEGKIRAYGVCNFGPGDLGELLPIGQIVTNQLPYNLLWRAIEWEIVPVCTEHQIGILPYSPLMQGLLTGKFSSPEEVPEGRARSRHFSGRRPLSRHGEEGAEVETFSAIAQIRQISERIGAPMSHVALSWLLAQPGVTSVLAGARNPQQVRENARASDLKLAPGVVDELNRATDALKGRLGPDPDMWAPESRYQ